MSADDYPLNERFRRVLDTLKFSQNLGHPSDQRYALDAFWWLYDQGEQAEPEAIAKYLNRQGWDPETSRRAELLWEEVIDMKDRWSGKRQSMFDPTNL